LVAGGGWWCSIWRIVVLGVFLCCERVWVEKGRTMERKAKQRVCYVFCIKKNVKNKINWVWAGPPLIENMDVEI